MQAKSIVMTMALSLAVAAMPLAALAQSRANPAAHMPPHAAMQARHGLRCLATDGKTPCTPGQVAALNRGLLSARQTTPALAGVRSVTLASPDGTIRCVQNSGAVCTDAQILAVQQYVVKKKKKGGGGCLCVMRMLDKSSV